MPMAPRGVRVRRGPVPPVPSSPSLLSERPSRVSAEPCSPQGRSPPEQERRMSPPGRVTAAGDLPAVPGQRTVGARTRQGGARCLSTDAHVRHPHPKRYTRCLTTFEDDPDQCDPPCRQNVPGRAEAGSTRRRSSIAPTGSTTCCGGWRRRHLRGAAQKTNEEVGPRAAVKVLLAARDEGPYVRRLATEAQIIQGSLTPHRAVPRLRAPVRALALPADPLRRRREPPRPHAQGGHPVRSGGLCRGPTDLLRPRQGTRARNRPPRPQARERAAGSTGRSGRRAPRAGGRLRHREGAGRPGRRQHPGGGLRRNAPVRSPEQFVGAVSEAADVYGVGALYFTMARHVVRRRPLGRGPAALTEHLPPTVVRDQDPPDDVARMNAVMPSPCG